MATFRMRATLRGIKPSTTRTFAAPTDISFLDLHLIIQAIAGWGGRYSHCFRIGEKKIGAKDYGVLEEADEMVEDYLDNKITYEFGEFTVDLMFLKGKTEETAVPVILEGSEDFPPEECKDLDEYLDVLKVMEDPSNPSYDDISSWLKTVSDCQQAEEVNKDFRENWERMGKIEGRVPFNVAAAVGALLITGCDGYFYDSEKKILTEESDGSARYIPVELKDNFINHLAEIYCGMIDLKSDNPIEDLLEDEYRQGWEEYAENFLDEITDHWADDHGFIVESYADSDISKMMAVFDGESQE